MVLGTFCPAREKNRKSALIGFMRTPIHMLWSTLGSIGLWKVRETVRCIADRKKAEIFSGPKFRGKRISVWDVSPPNLVRIHGGLRELFPKNRFVAILIGCSHYVAAANEKYLAYGGLFFDICRGLGIVPYQLQEEVKIEAIMYRGSNMKYGAASSFAHFSPYFYFRFGW